MIKKILCFNLILSFFFSITFAEIKKNIINNIDTIESLNFNFTQSTNVSEEFGESLLLFPEKLKCNYEDESLKELIINGKTLAITKKKYNKTYYYPISKSPFFKILNKKELKNIINLSDVELINNIIHLKYYDTENQKIIIFFNEKNFDLLGWQIDDQFNNSTKFLISIFSKNSFINEDTFKIPTFN